MTVGEGSRATFDASIPSDLVVAGRARGSRGSFRPPSDKSISLRALLLAALAEGESRIEGLLEAVDLDAMQGALRALGATIGNEDGITVVRGGREALAGRPLEVDAVESGTTARLLMGALAGVDREVSIDGRPGLRRRPMRRVVEPLSRMGVTFAPPDGDALPLRIRGRARLTPIHFTPDVASAQVKSAVLIAALSAPGATTVVEPAPSRDHTERMLARFGARVERSGAGTTLVGPQGLSAARIAVPADPSSALYAGVLGLVLDSSRVEARDVGVNPTRAGAIEVLSRMGASIGRTDLRTEEEGQVEPVADLVFASSELRGVDVDPRTFASLLDDVPILCVAAALARNGVTTIRGAAELRVKESDRIDSVAAMLRAFGCEVETTADSIAVRGGCRLHAGEVDARNDHRIAMAATVLGLAVEGTSRILGFQCTAKSYPGFVADLAAIGVDRERMTVAAASGR